MTRTCKIVIYAVLALAVMLVSVGCGDELVRLDISADTYSYTHELNLFEPSFDDDTLTETVEESEFIETVDFPEAIAVISPAAEDVYDDTTNYVYDDTAGVVYWVANGEVWHISHGCRTLARSKKILSGTTVEAIEAGKTRVCKVCGG